MFSGSDAHISRGRNAVHPISVYLFHQGIMRKFVTNQTLNSVSRRHLSPEMRFSRRHVAIARGGVQWSYFVEPFLGPLLGSEVGAPKCTRTVIRLFVLPKSRPEQLYSKPWKAGGTFVSWANRPAGVPSRPVPPRPADRPCPAQTRL